MTRKIIVLALISLFLIAGSAFAELSKMAPRVEHKQTTGNEELPLANAIPYTPGVATESPGDIIGYTYYDYQTNGSSGNRVCIVDDGTKYFDWMNLFSWPYPPAPRHVYVNWADAEGTYAWPGEGFQVSENTGSGYTNMDLYGNRGALAYHQGDNVIVSIEWDPPGMGFFEHHIVPNELFPQTPDGPGICMWPYVAVDRNDNIHVIATENTELRMQRLGYTRSEDEGATWSTFTLIDTVQVIGGVIDASPVSDRVVVAYPKTQDTTTQWNNDIVYFTSEDGTTWDWRYGMNNVTNYLTDDDSLWAYTDMDVIFDYNDYVHLLWTAQWVTDEGIYYRTDMFHYSEETEQITNIAHKPDSLWIEIEGAWNRTMSKMSLGVHEGSDGIFATWTQFDTSDVSAGGFGNGDLFMTYSADGGGTWASPVNMTNSATPGCFPGECDSDHWSSLASVVDDNLHILYTNDKDAGGIPQEEGAATENPMKYLMFPNPLATGIEDEVNRPVNFSLNQNYPNPFNASTVISFNLKEAAPVTIDVFDITGAKVTTLIEGDLTAGNHDVTWNASDVASGVYYYKLSAGDATETMRAVLIK
ncbi:MAG: T9SS type A sorting domain-containing protein [candidate division Zixibacteria bacterium]|nr:T9SS type A sorting domain-containing protein [candidate division Zixibacteria bacterium]